MPLYDYKCGKCGQVFEVRQGFNDPLLTSHEGCGGPVERLLSAPALQFKGSGWYITDYARSGNAGTKKSEGKSESKSSDSGSSSTSSTSSTSSSGDSKK